MKMAWIQWLQMMKIRARIGNVLGAKSCLKNCLPSDVRWNIRIIHNVSLPSSGPRTGGPVRCADVFTVINVFYHILKSRIRHSMTTKLDRPSLFMGGVFAFIFNPLGEILILREDGGSRKYDWDLPGGTLTDEESPVEGLHREVFEETGLTIRLLTLSCFLKWDQHESGYPILVAFYLAQSSSKEVCLSEEHIAYQWVSRDRIKSEGIILPPSESIIDAVFRLYELVQPHV
jgi:8-oxo-dGTP diphosphatase